MILMIDPRKQDQRELKQNRLVVILIIRILFILFNFKFEVLIVISWYLFYY